MAYATVMVHVDFDAATEARVRLAAGLADRFQSTLIGIAACAPQTLFVRGGVAIAPLFTQDNLEGLKAALHQQEHRFRSVAADGSRPIEWRSSLDLPTEFLAREARAADLVIIGRGHLSGDPHPSFDPGVFLLKAGRPVVTVPNGLDQLRAARVAIAWKDTREARRALSDSMPFLRDAEKVFLVEVCEDHDAEAAQRRVSDVINYLTRHHITTSTGLVLRARNATDELLRVIRTEKVDLLVAGAYGHSRLGEWAFGGVTRDFLHKGPVCCLFSH